MSSNLPEPVGDLVAAYDNDLLAVVRFGAGIVVRDHASDNRDPVAMFPVTGDGDFDASVVKPRVALFMAAPSLLTAAQTVLLQEADYGSLWPTDPENPEYCDYPQFDNERWYPHWYELLQAVLHVEPTWYADVFSKR